MHKMHLHACAWTLYQGFDANYQPAEDTELPQKAKTRMPSVPKKNLPWEEAILQILGEAQEALHYTEIAERIISNGLRHSVGATPAQTVASYLSASLHNESSPYLRVGRGEYALKAIAGRSAQDKLGVEKSAGQTTETKTGALQAFGMFWQRDLVEWSGTNLLGRQGAGATDVNFSEQKGVYLLHDRERVIYVGRATDTLFARLKAHTLDRLGGREDRFSWFGLREVKSTGELSDYEVLWNHNVVVETMEALLIESLEPPLNRRRGDNLSSIEYIQAEDLNSKQKDRRIFLIGCKKSFLRRNYDFPVIHFIFQRSVEAGSRGKLAILGQAFETSAAWLLVTPPISWR